MHILLTVFLSALPAFSSFSALDELEEFLEGAESGIEGVDFEVINDLRRHSTTFETPPSESIASDKRKYVKAIRPTTFRAVLRRGSIIYDLKGENSYRIGRDIYDLAREKDGVEGLCYLLGKEKKSLYYTDTANLQSIDKTIDLRPEAVKDRHLRGRGEFLGSMDSNKSLTVRHDFSVAGERTSGPYIDAILDIAPGSSNTNVMRLDWKAYYLSALPFNMGIHLGANRGAIQGANPNRQLVSASWMSMSLGPSVQYTLNSVWDISMSYQKSIFHKMVSGHNSYTLSTHSWQLDITRDFKTPLGILFVGVGYRVPVYRLKNSTVLASRSSSLGHNKAFAMILGYNYDMKLW